MKRDLHFAMTYPHPIEHVWLTITSAEAMTQWLMPNDFKPVLGHRFQFRTKPAPGFDGIVHCEVLEMTPPERLVYSWKGGGVDTRLIWTLKSVPEGTSLSLDHIGFQGLRGLFVSGILGKGWRSKILAVNLPAMLNQWSGSGPVPDVTEASCHREKSA
jgi:uncharacterized protein YndB with AHSA1/START domain